MSKKRPHGWPPTEPAQFRFKSITPAPSRTDEIQCDGATASDLTTYVAASSGMRSAVSTSPAATEALDFEACDDGGALRAAVKSKEAENRALRTKLSEVRMTTFKLGPAIRAELASKHSQIEGLRKELLIKEDRLRLTQLCYDNAQKDIVERCQQWSKQDTELVDLRRELTIAKAQIRDLEDEPVARHAMRTFWMALEDAKHDVGRDLKPRFSFQDFPGELRNKVYEALLVTDQPIDLWPIKPVGAPESTTHLTILRKQMRSLNVGILRASKQTHEEGVAILYGHNRFRFSDRHGWTILYGWLTSINLNCNHIQHLSVQYPDLWSFECHRDRTVTPATDVTADVKNALQATLASFGRIELNSPTGPQSGATYAFNDAKNILDRLPRLRVLNLIVPHNMSVEYFDSTFKPGIDSMDARPVIRSIIFIKRHDLQPKYALIGDLEDHALMGRDDCMALAVACGFKVQVARYGTWWERTSYIVDQEPVFYPTAETKKPDHLAMLQHKESPPKEMILVLAGIGGITVMRFLAAAIAWFADTLGSWIWGEGYML